MKPSKVGKTLRSATAFVALIGLADGALGAGYDLGPVRLPTVAPATGNAPVSYEYSAPETAAQPVGGYLTQGAPADVAGESLIWARAGRSDRSHFMSGRGETYRVGDTRQQKPAVAVAQRVVTPQAVAPETVAPQAVAPQVPAPQAVTPLGDAPAASGVEGVGFHHSACGTCCQTPCCCCPPPCCPKPCFWVGGVEATFLGADVGRNDVSYLLQDTIAAPAVNVAVDNPAELDDLFISPRLWLGFQRCNWGVVARYWGLQNNASAYDPFFFAPGGFEGIQDVGYFAMNQLDMYTIDVEGTYNFCCCRVKNTMSFGVRYASAEHVSGLSATADVEGNVGIGTITNYAYSRAAADGTGLTGSWFARKPLFPCSCIHLLCGVRGSVLWGDTAAIAETGSTAQEPGSGSASNNIAVTGNDETMFIGEAQLGLQWDYRVQCFPADAFFRVVAEYQYWNADGGSAEAQSFSGFGGPDPTPFSQGTTTARADSMDIDLYGFSIGAGFNW